MLFGLQEWIHRMEEGGGAKFVKALTLFAAVVALAFTYNARHYENYSVPEAMDVAQVARNLSEGKGFTTQFLRPVSLWMVNAKGGDMRLDAHPDLANAPLYPYLLAGWMKLVPMEWAVPREQFRTYAPEVSIGWLNQGLFVLALWLTYALTRRLFDEGVAWLTVVVLTGLDMLWSFSISGLSTMLLTVLVLLLARCLVALESGGREAGYGTAKLLAWALLAGILAGACGLTRYAFLGLIGPVILFVAVGVDRQKVAVGLAVLFGFAAVTAPWLARNYQLSGHALGVAGLSVYGDTPRFPGDRLERTLNPMNPDSPADFSKVDLGEHWDKLWANLPRVIQDDLPRLGGTWIMALFLAGLLLPFRSPTLTRLRVFVVAALAVLAMAQAAGRSWVKDLMPDVQGENLLIVFIPLAVAYGAGLYNLLLEQRNLVHPALRNMANGLFVLLACIPLLFKLTGNVAWPVAYPPYYPPAIQEFAAWLQPEEMMMSDVPWAVAWYGRRSCVWLTRGMQEDLRALQQKKAVVALYLTQLTMDRRLVSDLMRDRENSWGRLGLKAKMKKDMEAAAEKDAQWGNFALAAVLKEEVPEGFGLLASPGPETMVGSQFPEQLFLADRPRWNPK